MLDDGMIVDSELNPWYFGKEEKVGVLEREAAFILQHCVTSQNVGCLEAKHDSCRTGLGHRAWLDVCK
jgi:hypothetical protein